VVGALDGAVMGPTFRAGYLRQAAINKLLQLEEQHGESVAFEILGPPRMSKLLFESYLLKSVYDNKMGGPLADTPEQMAEKLAAAINSNAPLRQQIISVGLPVLLPDGESMLRGPVVKSETAEQGWIDLTPKNMAHWQERLKQIRAMMEEQISGDDTSSRYDRFHPSLRMWTNDDTFHIGEVAAWVSIYEDHGRRGKD